MATDQDKTPQAETPLIPHDPAIPTQAPTEAASDPADAVVVQCANLFLNVRRLLFMSLGALALTADEARDFIDRLSERSEVRPEEVGHWLADLHPPLPTKHNGGDGHVDALWGRLRVPTRRELEAISHKIDELDQKLAVLRARRTSSPPPSSDPATPPER